MSKPTERIEQLTPLQRAVFVLKETQAKLDALERDQVEPIAIIGVGCRFSGGGDNPEAFWRMLCEGRHGIREVPAQRWDVDALYDQDPSTPGKMATRWGGFLDKVDGFDPEFFGISPREAARIEPQQRLLLEVTWEALESAGLPPGKLAGSHTGVFVGIIGHDWAYVLGADRLLIDAYDGTGNSHSIAANRLSYLWDLRGPSVSLDTACSSSLVAVHLACQSLRRRESDLALAGGVNLILGPEMTIALSHARMLSPTGFCKTFDASADGYVRGEGCGMVVLKRLSDALADRDPIVAVIRGTAINQDGRSNGLTAPNGPAQQEVIRAALADAGVEPGQIGYIETHGTGTPLGDPIEIQALLEVLGPGRAPNNPVVVGSVKTNIGHLEAGAGIAGLIKAILALKYERIPPHLHLKTINPHLVPEGESIDIPTEVRPWPRSDTPRFAGLSSFGFGGTNSHAILQEPPAEVQSEDGPGVERPRHLVALSARTAPALAEVIDRFQAHLEANPTASLPNIAYTANVGRTHFSNRLAVVAASTEELREELRAHVSGRETPAVKSGQAAGKGPPPIAFLFTGQGAQYVGMGRTLYETQPTFRQALERCDEWLRAYRERSLLSVLYPSGADESLLDQTGYTQPALFAFEYALAELWKSWGIVPSAVMGHSVGEYAAACVAGVFSPEDGLRLIAERARLMQALPPGGAMVAVFASEAKVAAALKRHGGSVAIAALNGPNNVVISGPEADVQNVVAGLSAEGISGQRLVTSHAFHSQLLDPMLDAFERAAASVAYAPPKIDLISNLTGLPADERTYEPGYWRRHARQPVCFATGLQTLADRGYTMFLEIGPSPTLLGMARRCLPEGRAVWLPSLRKGRDDWQALLESLAALYTHGAAIDGAGLDRDYPARRRVLLPTYPFQRQTYWLEEAGQKPGGAPSARPAGTAGGLLHPLLGRRLPASIAERIFEVELSPASPSILADHRAYGEVLLSGSALLEMALAAGTTLGQGPWGVEEFAILQPLVFLGKAARTVQTVLTPQADGTTKFQIASLEGTGPTEEPGWTIHAAGRLRHYEAANTMRNGRTNDLAEERKRFTGEPFDHAWRANALRASGLEPGPTFCWIDLHWIEDGHTLGKMRAAQTADQVDAFQIHPGLLDCGFQLIGAALPGAGKGIDAYIPAGIGRLQVYGRPSGTSWYLTKINKLEAGDAWGEIRLFDDTGHLLVEMTGVRLKQVPRDWLQRIVKGPPPDWLYEWTWQPKSLDRAAHRENREGQGRWLLVCQAAGVTGSLAAALRGRLEASGELCQVIAPETPEQVQNQVTNFLSADGPPYRGVVHLAGLNLGGPVTDTAPDLEAAGALGCGGVLDLVQALTRTDRPRLPRLWLVTRGAQPVATPPTPLSLAQAPLWGLGRVIAAEHPELACSRIDLDPAVVGDPGSSDPGSQADSLFEEIWANDREDQVAFRAGQRYVARVAHLGRTSRKDLQVPEGRPYRLEITTRGELDNLALRPVVRQSPGPGEVEVHVRATGLNFRDVLNLLGLYPGDAGLLGGECAGEVAAVGQGVEGLKVGDPVVAMGPGSFGSYMTTLAHFVVPKPEHLDYDEAATIPIAFLTAHYALRCLGKMKAGDRVLIHAASGGVGLAAVQLAHKSAVEVFATAGNPEKRAFLQERGVAHVMDSRSLDFAAQVKEATNGRGVDLVLNSLTGEAIASSLSLLAPGGRFLEIGKTDLWDQERVAQVNPGASYHAIALDQMMADNPASVGTLLRELMAEFAEHKLEPLPHRVFPMQEAVEAFRHMARAKHIGKIVVASSGERGASARHLALRADRTYLVTGGLGGLGLKVARWLVDRGARHLVLVGRSGAADSVRPALRELEGAGANVVVAKSDMGRKQDVVHLLGETAAAQPPLAGIFHAAGVLDDGLLRHQNRARFAKVMAPKVEGGWYLHEFTRDKPLDFFVLFSSVASLLGSPGQGNYAAANAFLDALAHHRRAEGKTALTVNWGSWAEVGMAAALEKTEGQRWAATGLGWIQPAQGLETLEQLLLEGRTQAAVMPIDWPKFLQRIPAGSEPPWLSDIIRQARPEAQTASGPAELVQKLDAVTPGERLDVVLTYVREQAAHVLRLNVAELPDPRRPLNELGFDSLMAVELCNALGRGIGQRLPPTVLFDYPTLDALAGHLAKNVLKLEMPTIDGAPEAEADSLRAEALAEVEGLSEEEMDSLISREMTKLQQ
jgi:myxalamid-type polyketide synthase MxaB